MNGNGYQLSRRWWDWCFQHPGQHTPAHAALYAWYTEACNRAEWPDTFEMAPQYAMAAIGVRSYNTYKDTLADLQAWGFVRIRQKGANQWVPWILALSNFDEPLNNPLDKAKADAVSNFDIPLNKARNKATDEACNNPRDAYTINNKPTNLKPQTSNKTTVAVAPDEVEEIVDTSKQKKGKAPPVPPAPPGALPFAEHFAEQWQEWLTYRKEKNLATYKPIGLKAALTELVNLSGNDEESAVAILKQSIAKNWNGLFPLRDNSSHVQNNRSQQNGRRAGGGQTAEPYAFDLSRALANNAAPNGNADSQGNDFADFEFA